MANATSRGSFLPKLIVAAVVLIVAFFLAAPHFQFADATPAISIPKGSSYNRNWKRVDSLADAGLYRTADTLAQLLLEKARTEKNDAQLVKALLCRFSMAKEFDEAAEKNAIYTTEAEIKKAKFPLKQVLHTLVGEMYEQYIDDFGYQHNSRSATENFQNDSIDTWDNEKLATAAVEHFRASLLPADSLLKTPVGTFAEIIHPGDSAANRLRPSLYDLLAHRAINFYSGANRRFRHPEKSFRVDQPVFFFPVNDFVKLDLPAVPGDSMAMQCEALNVYRQLLSARLKDTAVAALMDADRLRLEFVHDQYTGGEKDGLYETSLRKLALLHPGNFVTADVLFDLARLYNAQGEDYKPYENETVRWKKKTALALCDSTVARYPKTLGGENCAALAADIRRPSLSTTFDRVVFPDRPFAGLLQVQNVDTTYFRITKIISGKEFENEEDRLDYYLAQPVVQDWNVSVPSGGDYQQHSAQVKYPALPPGDYVLLLSKRNNFSLNTKKNALAYEEFHVSAIAYCKREMQDVHEYLVVNRLTGEPLGGAEAQVWNSFYNSSTRKTEYRKGPLLRASKEGIVLVDRLKNPDNYYLELKWKNNRLETGMSWRNNYWYETKREPRKAETTTTFFTDRAIYRPGQTVYFKGIMVEHGKTSRLVTHQKTTVTLRDVNNQDVKSLELETNDYGSFSGSFVLPDNGLTGDMTLHNETGDKDLSVEEYKRPKFAIAFDNVKGQVRLGDKIDITGTARTFAGSPLDNATVKYHVERNSGYDWFEDYDYNRERVTDKVIADGTVTVNDTGGFVFSFIAGIDSSKITPQEFCSYTITIDVTDISGETHSESKSLTVRKQPLQLDCYIGASREKSPTDSVTISLSNSDGEPIHSDVAVKVYRMKPAVAFQPEREWVRPDRFLYPKEAWEKDFPGLPYDYQPDSAKWKRDKVVFETTYNTASKLPLALSGEEKWESGTYEFEAVTHDQFGNVVKVTEQLALYSTDDKKAFPLDPYTLITIKPHVVPGERALFKVGTAFREATLYYDVAAGGKIIYRKHLTVTPDLSTVAIPIPKTLEQDWCQVNFTLVSNSRMYSFQSFIYVHQPSAPQAAPLEISYETFRDKLVPGQQEEWRLKIKGEKGEKVAAEMVATMYDASLDEFRMNNWDFNPWVLSDNNYAILPQWDGFFSGTTNSTTYGYWGWWMLNNYGSRSYDEINWFGYLHYSYNSRFCLVDLDKTEPDSSKQIGLNWQGYSNQAIADSISSVAVGYAKSGSYDVVVMDANGATASASEVSANATYAVTLEATGSVSYMWNMSDGQSKPLSEVKARKNLDETVFFYPHLLTDSTGAIVISFTMKEALTKWRFMAFAHTKDLRYTQSSREIITQKDLMVMPNAPRFFREGDHITFTARVANLTAGTLNGSAQLQLFDALTMQPIDAKFGNTNAKIPFTAEAGKGAPLSWELTVPEGVSAVTYRVVASAGNFSDGEENAVPVLSNRRLVTETLPLWVRGGESKEFRFEKLISQNGGSTTLRNQKLTLEFTSNPAWYAVQSLPYLMEFPHECAEQTFNRFYANSIATNIANSSPKMRAVFESWKGKSPEAFLSNLEKNQELKNTVLSETPWVLEAQDESERKRRVGLLFDVNHMADENGRAFQKLKMMQYDNGGWPWFEGMPEDRYITQYVIAGFGQLARLGSNTEESTEMVDKAIAYCDTRLGEDYAWIKKHDAANIDKDHLDYIAIQYLYARSYFVNAPFTESNRKAFDYYIAQAKKYWNTKSRYMQGMLALALFRNGDTQTANAIMRSLSETAIHNAELGMYWKENVAGWYWYEAPIETQSLLIEAFHEVKNDEKSVDEMRTWLLRNKQQQDWKTTRATADACYALLMNGTDWLATASDVQIVVGAKQVDPSANGQAEAGTGYFKTSWPGSEVMPEMGKVKISKPGAGVSYGAMYWQYFENMDKITPAKSPLQVTRKLFLQKKTPNGMVLEAITEQTALHPGDKVTVRIEMRNDRDMEYIHLKDLRASGFEPVNVFSQYNYQDGLGYYESTKDASTDFFFSFLPKGAHVFEYPLTVIHAGDFSCGVAEAQCMYAPEFAAHSEGLRVKVTK